MPAEHADFGEYLRDVDILPGRGLMKSEYKSITKLMQESLDNGYFGVFDYLHPMVRKESRCPTCGDIRCGCEFHQNSCSHIVKAYMEEVYNEGR